MSDVNRRFPTFMSVVKRRFPVLITEEISSDNEHGPPGVPQQTGVGSRRSVSNLIPLCQRYRYDLHPLCHTYRRKTGTCKREFRNPWCKDSQESCRVIICVLRRVRSQVRLLFGSIKIFIFTFTKYSRRFWTGYLCVNPNLVTQNETMSWPSPSDVLEMFGDSDEHEMFTEDKINNGLLIF